MQSTAQILIVDNHSIVRAGLCSLLDREPDIDVIIDVDNGKDAVRYTDQLKPDLVVFDLPMSQTSSTYTIQQIKKYSPQTKILVLTALKNEEYLHAALKAGANGYMLKDDSCDELLLAIKNILVGKTYLSASVCGNVVTGYLSESGNTRKPSSIDTLTARECEVMKLIAEGFRNKDVAGRLSISLKTVEKHRSNMMSKLNLHNTSNLTCFAIRNGIITA